MQGPHIRGGRAWVKLALTTLCLCLAPAWVRADASSGPNLARDLGDSDTLRVVFSAETHGNLEPCPCKDRPLGGLARRVGHFVATVHADQATLRLDSGGFLPVADVPLRDDPAVLTRYVRLLTRALIRSRLDAVALDGGHETLLARVAPREWESLGPAALSANPVGRARYFRWGDRGVAVLAVESGVREEALRLAARTAREEGAALVGGSATRTVLILLARADAWQGQNLARMVQPDLVLLSRGARPRGPIQIGPTTLVGCGIDGKEMGEVRIAETALGLEFAGFSLQPMDETVAPDPEIGSETDRLLREDGASLRASVLGTE